MNSEEQEQQEWRADQRRRLVEAHERGELTDAEYRRRLEDLAKSHLILLGEELEDKKLL